MDPVQNLNNVITYDSKCYVIKTQLPIDRPVIVSDYAYGVNTGYFVIYEHDLLC